jgi:hypothetical protein
MTMAQPGLIDYSIIGDLPEVYAKAQDRAQKSAFEESLKGFKGDYGDLVRRAAAAGYMPGIQLGSQLANAEATRRLQMATLAEHVRHNKASEAMPRIVGSGEGGYYAIDRNGNLVQPGQNQPLPSPAVPSPWDAPQGALPQPNAPAIGPGAALGGGPALAQGPFPVSPSDELINQAQQGGAPPQPPGPQFAGPPTLPSGGGAVPPWLAGAAVPAPPGARPAPTAPAPAPGLPPGVRQIIPGKPKTAADVPILKNDPIALTQFAAQARAGDTSVFTNLGKGAQGPENIMALRTEMARQDRELPRDDHEEELRGHGVSQAMRNAEYFGLRAGQRTMGTRVANIEMAATEFKKLLPIVERASDAVSRTEYPDINKLILAWQQKTGDPAVVQLGGAINTAVNVYARAIAPSGAATVSDKDHAREILQRAWAKGQIKGALGMMGTEIDAALAAPDEVREAWRKRFREGQVRGGGAPPPAATPAPAEPKRTKSGLQWSIEP